MASSSSPHRAQAQRALIADIKQDKRTWLKHGAAALAVSVLGLGVAASLSLTGSAQISPTQSTAGQSSAGQSSASGAELTLASTDRRVTSPSRASDRPALDAKKVKSLADQRAEELKKTDEEIAAAANAKSAKARNKALESTSAATRRRATQLTGDQSSAADDRSATTTPTRDAGPLASGGKSCLPVARGYSIAARFGQVGSWSRYHTGFDFSAPVGTRLRASAPGVVTNAGIGKASGWAGNYVAIKHADGTQTMMAHMSTVSVSVGQTVSACEEVGAIGMTGRTFGPHVHFEVYPAGITPGDVYKAENPASWLNARGLKP